MALAEFHPISQAEQHLLKNRPGHLPQCPDIWLFQISIAKRGQIMLNQPRLTGLTRSQQRNHRVLTQQNLEFFRDFSLNHCTITIRRQKHERIYFLSSLLYSTLVSFFINHRPLVPCPLACSIPTPNCQPEDRQCDRTLVCYW